VVAAAVVAMSVVPLLLNPRFYFWDDTAASYVPTWVRIGEELLAGRLPQLENDLWRGGNFAGDAQFGLYSPIIWVLAIATHWVDDLYLLPWLFKLPFLVLLAMGVLFLARALGASRPIAAVAGFAVPFMGFTFWFDATSWPMSLFITAMIPWLNLALLKVAQGGRLIGLALWTLALLGLGTPYGAVAAAVVYAGWLIWMLWRRAWGAAVRVVAVGVGCVLVASLPYLVFSGTVGVGYRRGVLANDEFLRPGVGDLVNMSNPAYFPAAKVFGDGRLDFPAAYLAWFLIPTSLWIGSRFRGAAAAMVPLMIQMVLCTVLILSPSHTWFFR